MSASSSRLSRHASTLGMHVNRGPPIDTPGSASTAGVVLVDDLASNELASYLETRILGFFACFALGMVANAWYQMKKRQRPAGAPSSLTKAPFCIEPKFYVVRLTPSQEIKANLEQFVRENDISAGAIVSCVGSTEKAVMRLANASATEAGSVLHVSDKCEILSLSGTLGTNGMHIHLSLGDDKGQVVGGHLVSALVNTTCELVIADFSQGLRFTRSMDKSTGFKELQVHSLQ